MTENEMKAWLMIAENVRPALPDTLSLHELLDAGGQGVVYKGMAENVEAAIKIYFPGQTDKRIEREIKALKEIQATTIVDLLWSDRISFSGYQLNVVATTFVHGTPLSHVIKDGGVEDSQLGIVAYDVAHAIKKMWEKKIVHRDLKPSNIMLRPTKRACVIDLGIARHVADTTLTQVGMTWGSRGYFSPEQGAGAHQLTYRSDIFALGIVLMEAALGRHPTSWDQKRLEARRFHEDMPAELAEWPYADLVKQMLQPVPVKRPRPETIMARLSAFIDPERGE